MSIVNKMKLRILSLGHLSTVQILPTVVISHFVTSYFIILLQCLPRGDSKSVL